MTGTETSQELSRRGLLPAIHRYRSESRGAAAAEFALVLIFLVVPLLNVIDLGLYIYDRMLLDNAAQIGAQAAFSACASPTTLPATNNCPALSPAVAVAAKSTSLSAEVAVSSIAEKYYCTSAGALTEVGDIPSANPGPNCAATGKPPGDYILITTSYTYTPLFAAVSIASLLTTPIARTAWMRLG